MNGGARTKLRAAAKPEKRRSRYIMFKNLLIGQYIDTGSVLHRLDARLKLTALLGAAVMIFSAGSVLGLAYSAALCAAVTAASRLSPAALMRGLRPVMFLAAFAVLFTPFSSEGTELFSLGPLSFTAEGLVNGCFAALRLIMLAAYASVLTLTTKPLDLTAGIESLLSPLSLFRVPVRDIAVMTGIALRFIPTLGNEARIIADAQKSRCAPLDGKGIINKARAALPLVIPLIAGAFRHSDALADAMDARCYGMGKRTRMNGHKFGKTDIFAALICAAAAAVFAAAELAA